MARRKQPSFIIAFSPIPGDPTGFKSVRVVPLALSWQRGVPGEASYYRKVRKPAVGPESAYTLLPGRVLFELGSLMQVERASAELPETQEGLDREISRMVSSRRELFHPLIIRALGLPQTNPSRRRR